MIIRANFTLHYITEPDLEDASKLTEAKYKLSKWMKNEEEIVIEFDTDKGRASVLEVKRS